MKSSGLGKLKNERIESLLEQIKAEFITLREYVVVSYQHDENSPYVQRLDNLFKGFRDWANNPKGTPFVHPGKIFDYKAKIKAFDTKHLSTVYRSMRDLELKIHEIYETCYDAYSPSIIFDIEAAQRGGRGKHRLKVTIDGEEFVNIVERIKGIKRRPASTKVTLQSPAEQSQIIDHYLDQIEKDYRYLDTKHLGIIPLRKNSLTLDNIYIRLKATEKVPLSEALHLSKHMQYLSGIPQESVEGMKIFQRVPSPLLSIEQILQNAMKHQDETERHIVVLGFPGSGKTTLLRYLAWLVVSPKAEEWALNGFIPLFADLRDYASGGHRGLLQYALSKANENIVDEIQKHAMEKVLKETINECGKNGHANRRVLLLFDALDETGSRKNEIAEDIEHIRNEYKNAFFIVTSRITGYYESALSAFTPYLIEDLQIEETKTFINKWFLALVVEKSKEESNANWSGWAQERTDHLIARIETRPSLRRIATTPLYLTFLVLLAGDPDTDLPETRADLYNLYFRKLLLRWENKHALPCSSEYLFEGFKEICWVIHRALFGGIQNEPTEEFLEASIKWRADVTLGKVIQFWIKAGILLRVKTRRQAELILPHHLSFLEYGFACKLNDLWNFRAKQQKLWKHLRQNLYNHYLREPLLIFVNIMEDPSAFLESICNLKDDERFTNLTFLGDLIIQTKEKSKITSVIRKVLSRFLCLGRTKRALSDDLSIDFLVYISVIGGIDALVKLLEGKYPQYDRANIISLMRYEVDAASVPILTDLLWKTQDGTSRVGIASAISKVEGKKVTGLLKLMYHREKMGFVRGAIVGLIRDLRDKNTIPLLRELLSTENDLEVQLSIIDCLDELGERKLALSLLRKVRRQEMTCDEKSDFAYSLAKLGDEHGLYLLKELYNHENHPETRRSLIDKIGNLESDTPHFLLKQFFSKEKDLNVRIRIAYQLHERGDTSLISTVLPWLQKHIDTQSTTDILWLAGKRGDKKHIPLLEEVVSTNEDFNIATSAVTAICTIGHGTAIPILEQLYNKVADPELRQEIAYSIGELGNPELGISLLEKLFRAAKNDSRQYIQLVLERLAKNAGFVIHKGKNNRWRAAAFPGRYTF